MFATYKYGFIVWMKNIVDPDQLASSEASWSAFTLFFFYEEIELYMQRSR